MTTRFLQAALLGSLLSIAARPAAASRLSLLDTVGNPNRVDVPAGIAGDVTVFVRFDYAAPDEVNGLTFFLYSYDSNSAFRITGRTVTGLPMSTGALNIPITSDADLTASPGNGLSPMNARDIGLIGPTGSTLTTSGTIMTLTLSHAALPEGGDYRLNVDDRASYHDLTFRDHDLLRGPDYLVHIIPEPATLALVFAGLLFRRGRRGRDETNPN